MAASQPKREPEEEQGGQRINKDDLVFGGDAVDDAFLSLFAGKFSVSDSGAGWEQSLEFLRAGSAVKKSLTCVMFFSHPLRWLESGVVNRDGDVAEDFKGVDNQVLQFLPERSGGSVKEKRANSIYKGVNFTSVRRIALMALQNLPQKSIIAQWIKVHKGRPAQAPLPQPDPESEVKTQTNKILRETLEGFRAEYKPYVAEYQAIVRASK